MVKKPVKPSKRLMKDLKSIAALPVPERKGKEEDFLEHAMVESLEIVKRVIGGGIAKFAENKLQGTSEQKQAIAKLMRMAFNLGVTYTTKAHLKALQWEVVSEEELKNVMREFGMPVIVKKSTKKGRK